MKKSLLLLKVSLSLLISNFALAVNITVNPSSVIKTNSQAPLGVVLNQLVDGALSLSSLKNVVIQSGSKHLRFPEGESSDNYYFTDPLYISNPNPATARMANTSYWPVGSSLANSNGTLTQGLNFDQFMEVANAAGASPNIVLCYPCGDKVQALAMAKAWVKYSKDQGYNVINWEIGNETYLFNPNYTDDYAMTAAEYAKDIVEWAVALKAIDSRIKIGVNGKTKAWINTLLTYKHPSLNLYGSEVIDFLAIHVYSMYGSSFANYQNNQNAWGTLDFTSDLQPALDALQESATTSSTSHIRIAITECSTMNYSSSDPNNMGSALMTADMLMTLMKQTRVDYIELWGSRWIYNFSSSTPQGSDTFSSTNTLNPSGLALSALTKFSREKVVTTVGETTTLKSFASLSATGELSVILLNRSNSSQSVSLAVAGVTSLTGRKHSFSASSATSTSPTFDVVGTAVSSSSSTYTLSVPKTSFVVLNFTGVLTPPPPATNFILNPSFELGTANWVDWGNSAVVSGDSTHGISSLRIGLGSGGRVQTVTGLAPAASYVFKAKAKVGKVSDDAWFGVTFYNSSGAKIPGAEFTVQVTSGTYQTYSIPVTAPASFASVQVWAWKGAGTSYLYCDELSLSP